MLDEVFQPMPKIPRLRRDCVITEKIDGTNASVHISEDGLSIRAASRTRWITAEHDNAGFARWVDENKNALLQLGPGSHFGEWWGAGIQRRYDQADKHFSLFNVGRWADGHPHVVRLVPVLYEGVFSDNAVEDALFQLRLNGSFAAPGYKEPEGIVVYLSASRSLFKVTLDNDGHPKSRPQGEAAA